ncbi:hypothetical protein [Sorangium sp. So ce1151]|uniref:hypothetical protein n=1 Tax=Sorangium sp. So ce1151 TaxID=3133332 RepID=UPI003F5EE67A
MPARDRDDVLQECLIGAVVAVREGRYRPQPELEPRRILQRWLIGIAGHQARKYHEKAYRRREVALVDPLAYVVGRVPSPHGEGGQVSEVARSLGVPVGTAFGWLRRGRTRLAAVLKRWRRLR